MSSPTEAAASVPSPLPPAPSPPPGPVAGRSPGRLMRRRFRRDRTGVVSACVVVLFFAVGLLAPVISWLYGKDPYTLYGQEQSGLLDPFGFPAGPLGGVSGEHWFGLEPGLGRDVFMQLVYGIRTSLLIALAVTVATTLTAIVVGVTAGYLGGRTDYWLGRLMDFLLGFPSQLFFVAFMPVVVALFVDPREETPTWIRVTALVLVLWFLGWTGLGRLLRGQVLALREREFVEAAKVSGASPWRIVRKELLPNLVTPVLVQFTYMLPGVVTAQAGLSYLGVGLVEPTPDWGRMFATAGEVYENDPAYLFFPGTAMVVFVVCFNLLGDSLRDAFDPRTGR
ncbi:ABC transporter permease [Streptomyces sp. HB2AG]|uniref:ABC transporter permease n=1 Tax=Streptomyces sp. HB2AG TaxID=2983400 RepID=UPI0022AA23E1|nr:ABC transporter permease [Streptomyces sp. HB2AG]MCZ2527709.1 ABC transporter permease [Streptomyces sp. HB2AG]